MSAFERMFEGFTLDCGHNLAQEAAYAALDTFFKPRVFHECVAAGYLVLFNVQA